jgi:hypothetical protein
MDFPRASPFKADKQEPSGRQESVSMEVQGAGKELHTNQKKAAATAKVNRWGSSAKSAKQQVPEEGGENYKMRLQRRGNRINGLAIGKGCDI